MEKVVHPSHYNMTSRETIETIKDLTGTGFKGFLAGSVIKYLGRYPYKDNPLQDLKKCRWYIEKLIKEVENEQMQK